MADVLPGGLAQLLEELADRGAGPRPPGRLVGTVAKLLILRERAGTLPAADVFDGGGAEVRGHGPVAHIPEGMRLGESIGHEIELVEHERRWGLAQQRRGGLDHDRVARVDPLAEDRQAPPPYPDDTSANSLVIQYRRPRFRVEARSRIRTRSDPYSGPCVNPVNRWWNPNLGSGSKSPSYRSSPRSTRANSRSATSRGQRAVTAARNSWTREARRVTPSSFARSVTMSSSDSEAGGMPWSAWNSPHISSAKTASAPTSRLRASVTATAGFT